MEFNIKHTFDNLSPHFSGVKNAVKSFCSELGLCREMKRVSNSLYGSIMARPVGIVWKLKHKIPAKYLDKMMKI